MSAPTKPAPKSFLPTPEGQDGQTAQPGAAHCIVTGHSRGLGLALTDALLARQCRVLGISRGLVNAQSVSSDPLPAPNRLQEVGLDLSDSNALIDWINSGALNDFIAGAQRIVLINNAGQLGPVRLCGQTEQGDADAAQQIVKHHAAHDMVRALTVNVTAALLLTDAVLAASVGHPDRRIMHISSGAGRSAYAGWGTYCASKAALDHHARVLAVEGHAGLRASSVAPGVIDTDMQTQLRQTDPACFPMQGRFVTLKQAGGLSSPRQAAEALVEHLLSDRFGLEAVSDIRSL